MTVLQIGPYPPPFGGVQRNLVAIFTLLRRRGVPSAVINVTRHRQRDGDDVYFPKNALQLVRLLLRLPHAIVHIHFGGMLTLRTLALWLVCTLLPGRRTVLTFHSGGYPSTPEGRAAGPRALQAIVLRRFDGIVAVNQEIVAFLTRLGVAPGRIHLIAPHAFLAGEGVSGDLPDPLRGFFSSHSPVMLSVGLLEPEYDLGLQIELLGELRRTWPGAGLVLIGSGALEAELRRRIQARADREHILLCGDVPHPDTMRALARADVVLRTTRYDGDAVSVREALHLGTPVIATENGMRPAGVRVIPVGDARALEQAARRALTTPRPAERAELTPDETNIEAVLELYEQLHSARSRPVAAEDGLGNAHP